MDNHAGHRTLGRDRDQRRALLRSLAIELITHERITTTEAKAKELRPFVEKLVTKSTTDSVARRRDVDARIGGNDAATKRLFEDIAPRFSERPGGYTRIVKLPRPQGSGRSRAIIEFVA
jgi:large subunit ribosomal protein L17